MFKNYVLSKNLKKIREFDDYITARLRLLPSCYNCSKLDCEYRIVDDHVLSRINCPLYSRDINKDIVENI